MDYLGAFVLGVLCTNVIYAIFDIVSMCRCTLQIDEHDLINASADMPLIVCRESSPKN